MEQIGGSSWATFLIVVALFATSKTIMSNLLGSSRLLFDVARDSQISWLQRLTAVNEKTGTPIYAIIFITTGVIAFAAIGNLKIVASLSNYFVFLVFLAVNIALIRLRFMNKGAAEASFKVPGTIGKVPVLTVIAIVGLLILVGFNTINLFSGG